MRQLRTLLSGLSQSLCLSLCLSLGFSQAVLAQPQLLQHAHYSMGTVFRIRIYHDDSPVAKKQAEEAAQAALEVIEQADQRLSDWDEQSELMQAQAQAWPNSVAISQALWQDLEQALYYHQITHAAFDITVGPLLKLWGFRGENRPQRPSESDLELAKQKVGMKFIKLQAKPWSMQFSQPGLQLDFGGIGKGIAVDQAATVLSRLGITIAAIDCDSSSYFMGSPPGSEQGWPVLLRHPRDPKQVLTALWLRDQGLSTSGDDQQYFEVDGKRYSHILDPRTGRPVDTLGSLTVIAASATAADAWSTALMVLEPQEGNELASKHGIKLIRALPDSQGNWHLQGLD